MSKPAHVCRLMTNKKITRKRDHKYKCQINIIYPDPSKELLTFHRNTPDTGRVQEETGAGAVNLSQREGDAHILFPFLFIFKDEVFNIVCYIAISRQSFLILRVLCHSLHTTGLDSTTLSKCYGNKEKMN